VECVSRCPLGGRRSELDSPMGRLDFEEVDKRI